jgi:hypothetical protein
MLLAKTMMWSKHSRRIEFREAKARFQNQRKTNDQRALSWPGEFWRAMQRRASSRSVSTIRYLQRAPSKQAQRAAFPNPVTPAIWSKPFAGWVTVGYFCRPKSLKASHLRGLDLPKTVLTQREIEILRLLGCWQKPFRDRVASQCFLQDDCKYVFHQAPEARLALIIRSRALRDREPTGVT